jgi:hypothetical protein
LVPVVLPWDQMLLVVMDLTLYLARLLLLVVVVVVVLV